MNSVALELKNLHFSYQLNDSFALTNVNLRMRAGSINAILGPNGSGKTTMMKLMNGRLMPQQGDVLLYGKPLSSCSRREIGQQIGIVPQAERIAFEYTVLEYVCMGRTPWLSPLARPTERDIAIAADAIDDVGMGQWKHKPVTRLSGGQEQLILLARALAQETDIFLLDEPSSQLDLANKKKLLRLIQALAQNDKTILMTTHEPDIAAAIADKVVMMKSGQVVIAGPMESVFTAENLSSVYDTPIQLAEAAGKTVVIWT